MYLLHATQRGRKQRRGGEGKRKKGEKERGKGGEEKTSYISPQAMYILAWLTSVNQLIPMTVDQKRAKEVAPLIGHRPIGGLCGSVMPPQGTPCRATPDRNGCKARSALHPAGQIFTRAPKFRPHSRHTNHCQAHPHPYAQPTRFSPPHPIYLLHPNSNPAPLQPGTPTGAANRNLGHFLGYAEQQCVT